MLERLTDRAANAITLAEAESTRLGHAYVGTEQLLLGLIAEETGAAARALASFGIRLKSARTAVKRVIGLGSGINPKKLGYTPRAKNVLKNAGVVARDWEQDKIDTEHLLLGLLAEEDAVGNRVLEDEFGVHLDAVQSRLMLILKGQQFPVLDAPILQFPDPPDEDLPVSMDLEEALWQLWGRDSFVRAKSVSPEMLNWIPEGARAIGVYVNASDNYLVVCEEQIYWFDGAARINIEYASISAVNLPRDEDDPYLELILRRPNETLMLPVLHKTEDVDDFEIMWEFLWHVIRSPHARMKIGDINSTKDFVSFLREPGIANNSFEALASWIERGALNDVWLEAFGIDSKACEDASTWRLLASILTRFPELSLSSDRACRTGSKTSNPDSA
jgi:hypothetical protein